MFYKQASIKTQYSGILNTSLQTIHRGYVERAIQTAFQMKCWLIQYVIWNGDAQTYTFSLGIACTQATIRICIIIWFSNAHRQGQVIDIILSLVEEPKFGMIFINDQIQHPPFSLEIKLETCDGLKRSKFQFSLLMVSVMNTVFITFN